MGYRPDLRAVMLLAVGRWADSSRCGTTCAVPPTGRPGVPTRIRSSRSGPSPALDTHSLVEGPDPAAVAAKLNQMGFVAWRRLRPDHSVWKVDDARRADGKVYDIKLEAETLDLVKLELERD